MRITYRPVSKTDYPFLKKVYRSTREKDLVLTNWTDRQKDDFMEFQFNAQHSHYTNSFKAAEFKVIVINNKDIGRLYIWRSEKQIRIIDITLLPEYQKKGLGSKILKSLIKESEVTGKKLNLHVENNNLAIRLYKRIGFVHCVDFGTYKFMERIPGGK